MVLTTMEEKKGFKGYPSVFLAFLRIKNLEAQRRQAAANIYLGRYACIKLHGLHDWSPPHPDGRDMGSYCIRCGEPET
jgi:hypothetical protein